MPYPDVFISYSRKDRSRVEPIYKKLKGLKLEVWWDRKLQTGNSFRNVIQDYLNAASVVLVCWSKAAIKSQWVIDEAEEGQKRGVLIPARLDEVNAPLGLRGWQYTDLFGEKKEFDAVLVSLTDTVLKLLKHGVKPDRRYDDPFSYTMNRSKGGAKKLNKLSIDLLDAVKILGVSKETSEGLDVAFNEIYKTYKAVLDALNEFGSLQGKRGILRRPLKSIARGRLTVEISGRRGRCTAIGMAYWKPKKEGGIREALVKESFPNLKSLDKAFLSLHTLDDDVFKAMTAITEVMAVEAAAIYNHLAAGQDNVAKTRLSEDVLKLSKFEKELNEHMAIMLKFAGDLGITIKDNS